MYVEEGGARCNTKKGVVFALNALAFAEVFPMVPPSQGESIKIRISGLRVDAFKLGVISTLAPVTIQASVGFGQKQGYGYTSMTVTGRADIARIFPSLRFDVAFEQSTDALPMKLSRSEPRQDVVLRVTYHALFQNAFRPAERAVTK
jgi:hypothetical protein